MEAFTIDPSCPLAAESLIGAILTEEVSVNGRRLFHKGHRLIAADLVPLATVGWPLHAVRLGDDDIHEDDAGRRLASVVAGDNIAIRGPVQSRYNLVASAKGLLRVDAAAITALNRVAGMAVFTLPDRLAVVAGKIVAGAKIAPVAIPAAALAEAESVAGARSVPPVRVVAFRPLVVGVVTTEGMSDPLRERFQATVERKLGWYGARVLRFAEVPNEPAAVAAALAGLIDDGADLVLTGGGNTIDPLDPALVALGRIGAEMVRFGAPAHPGSMFWLAYRGEVPIFNLASCSLYSKATVADLVLPWVMAGERVVADDLAALGYGGLLDRGMGFRFPPYDAEAATEEDE